MTSAAAPSAGSPADGLRVVFDTNVLLSLYVFADSRYAPFRAAAEAGHWRALTSEPCLGEFRRVLGYPEFGLDAVAQTAALAAWTATAELVAVTAADAPPPVRELPRCKDRDDQKFLELARDGAAAWLITADKALLRLARRDRLRDLFRILTPDAALAELVESQARAFPAPAHTPSP